MREASFSKILGAHSRSGIFSSRKPFETEHRKVHSKYVREHRGCGTSMFFSACHVWVSAMSAIVAYGILIRRPVIGIKLCYHPGRRNVQSCAAVSLSFAHTVRHGACASRKHPIAWSYKQRFQRDLAGRRHAGYRCEAHNPMASKGDILPRYRCG